MGDDYDFVDCDDEVAGGGGGDLVVAFAVAPDDESDFGIVEYSGYLIGLAAVVHLDHD